MAMYGSSRSLIEIIFEVLSWTKTPEISSHIMYKTNTNSKHVKEFLSTLTQKGMVKTLPKSKSFGNRPKESYVITEHGLLVLAQWRKLLRLWHGKAQT